MITKERIAAIINERINQELESRDGTDFLIYLTSNRGVAETSEAAAEQIIKEINNARE